MRSGFPISPQGLEWFKMVLNGDEIVFMLYNILIIFKLLQGDIMPHNPKVVGSNPAPATNLIKGLQHLL